ncbi:hypothetical protein PFISCL1PPCAC_15359, partial [Pristionchus fissidentatus]
SILPFNHSSLFFHSQYHLFLIIIQSRFHHFLHIHPSMRLLFLLSSLFVLSSSFAIPLERFIDSKGRILFLFKHALTWNEANEFCDSLLPGSKLASLRDETEAIDIALHINNQNPHYNWGGTLNYFIGAQWNNEKSEWINPDGTRIPHPRPPCDNAVMQVEVRWQKGRLLHMCNAHIRPMYFICSETKS